MAKKSFIQREKKWYKLEQKYHLIHRSSKTKIRSNEFERKNKKQEKFQSPILELG